MIAFFLLAQIAPVIAIADSVSFVSVYKGFNYPTTFDFLPDNDVLVGEKSGLIYRVNSSNSEKTLVLDITQKVNSYTDRGLLTLRVNPFDTSKVLVYYVVDSALIHAVTSTPDTGLPAVSRLSEFSWSGDELNKLSFLDATSERVILGSDTDSTCINEEAPSPDCIPADSPFHNGGGLEFSAEPDVVYLSIGDAAGQYPHILTARAQNLDSYKIGRAHV